MIFAHTQIAPVGTAAAQLPVGRLQPSGRDDTALGAFYRRLSSRAGESKASDNATARKIAWFCSTKHPPVRALSYGDPGADHLRSNNIAQPASSPTFSGRAQVAFELRMWSHSARTAGIRLFREVRSRHLCWSSEMRFRFIEDRRADYPVSDHVRRAQASRLLAIMPGGCARRAREPPPTVNSSTTSSGFTATPMAAMAARASMPS